MALVLCLLGVLRTEANAKSKVRFGTQRLIKAEESAENLLSVRRLGIMLSSTSVRRMFVCLVLLLPAITGISAAGQSSSTLCAPTAHAVVLYAPESNLERREIETLRTAKVSVDVAMYSFTDHELAAELVRLARSGVRVRVYRDWREPARLFHHGNAAGGWGRGPCESFAGAVDRVPS